ncbi:hypothetical protein ACWCP6_01870 [Streptomyces sp. NPDC002004]
MGRDRRERAGRDVGGAAREGVRAAGGSEGVKAAGGSEERGAVSRDAGRGPALPGAAAGRDVAVDRRWASDLRSALFCALALFALIVLIDRANGTLTPARTVLWAALSVLLYLVLHPPRVTAGRGWLEVRGVWRTRRVTTGLLTAVRHSEGVAQRLTLRDALGNRVELDPRVLVDNPLLWHRLETGARTARANGFLRTGEETLRRLGERIDTETTRALFEASDLR